eukprot:jgi/Undpi1/101/HiC_scaffold_1.g00101.m1
MTGPARDSTGKGKGKAKPKDDSVGSMSRPAAETTPRSDREESSLGANSANSGVGGAMAAKALEVAKLCCSEPVEVPQRKTLFVLAVVVAVLAVFRSLLLPVPGDSQPAVVPPTMSVEQEDDLVRLVLAEELEGVAKKVQEEDRSFENMLERRAGALNEIKGFEDKLRATGMEMSDLEELGRAVQEDNGGDADLTTEVARAQEGLRDLHRSVTDALGGFKQQLEIQAQAMGTVRSELAKVAERAKDAQERAADLVHEYLEKKVVGTLEDVDMSLDFVKDRLGKLTADVLTELELEALLESAAAPPSDQPGASGGAGSVADRTHAESNLQGLSKAAVDRALDGVRGEGAGCVSVEHLREEVEDAIEKLMADGTGLRDYANVAVGGQVLTSNGLVSSTYTPSTWWGSSRYWHGAGVENGIGPVESVISEGSSLGACWAMSGSRGHVTVLLPREITVDGVSLEHASRMVTPESASAPKEFQVYGMRNKNDNFPVKLGDGTYDLEGRPIQTFAIEPLGRRFRVIQLRIVSNWGNPEYTCIYRVRVHGREAG